MLESTAKLIKALRKQSLPLEDRTASLKEGCVALVENHARQVIREQVRYLAVVEGIHKGLTPEQILFSKTALWNMQMEDQVIQEIIIQGVNIQG